MTSIWVSFLAATVIAATPLLFATLGGILNERAGHTNLGIEGMMLMGAVVGFSVSVHTENAFLALPAAAFSGAVGALIYAFLTVTMKTNHVVTGLALTIFGTGFANFVGASYSSNFVRIPEKVKATLSPLKIPLLSKIPVLGDILFNQNILSYMAYICAIVIGIYIYNTKIGLNLRTVGENPQAADGAGINVDLYKYVNIVLGGALCGLGGAYVSMAEVPMWQENITAGRGWIAVALIIFCTWNPYKAIFGSIFFGGLSIIYFRLSDFKIPISGHIVEMLPYAATIVALVISSTKKSKKNRPPAHLGLPYFREDR